MKKFLIILLFPCLCLSQDYDFFHTDDEGLIFTNDLFRDYVYAGEELEDSTISKINKAITGHQRNLKFTDTLSQSQLESYRELVFLFKIFDKSSLEYSENVYEIIRDNRTYRIYLFDVVKDLVINYNLINKPELSRQLLEENEEVLSNHKNFSCDTGSSYYYKDLAKLNFDTYGLLKDREVQLEYGFYYLLNTKEYSTKIIDVLSKVYSKSEIKKAFNDLDKNFIEMDKMTDCYFDFLGFKIDTRGRSGIYNYENAPKTPSEQLKNIWFYKHLETHLNK